VVNAEAAPVVATPRVNTFLARVYLLMTLGLVVAGQVAMNKQFLLRLPTSPWLAWGPFLVQLMVVLGLSSSVRRMSPGGAPVDAEDGPAMELQMRPR